MGDGLLNKIEVIQVLRFLAAFSVMMVHLPVIGFGIWGVDIFFVISGFIMMYVTENNQKNFLVKRIIRIVPLYWILTLGVFSIAIFYPDLLNNTTANFEHLIKSLFFIPFDKNGSGHFPILFLGWTLNFEVIFYILSKRRTFF
jgi:peptidoglycan/LPS O-acetylase OafA/YrhL